MTKISFKHIHIIGCSPRSGTTLMQEMLSSCFKVDYACEHEKSLFKIFEQSIPPGGVACTKHPLEAMYARQAMKLNPDLYVIYMIRDPRDVMTSRHANQSSDGYFADMGFYLQAHAHFLKLKGNPRFLAIKYEDLVCEPDTVQNRIAEKFGFLEIRHRFSDFHLHACISTDSARAMNGVRPPDRSSIGKWRNHLPRIRAQIAKYPKLLDLLVYLGYEKDDSWTSILPEKVDQSLADSAMKSRPGFANMFRMKLRVFRKTVRYAIKLSEYGKNGR